MSTRTDDRVSISAFIERCHRERLDELAREHDRSMSAEIRHAIARHVDLAHRAAPPPGAAALEGDEGRRPQ
jgi:predicted transcriptional regulator